MDYPELTLVFLLTAVFATLIGLIIARRRVFLFALRPIPAYAMLPESAADAVESANQIHFSMGSSAIGETSTVSALASAEIIYRLSERLAVGYRPALVTLSSAITLPLAQDTLRRAYEYRQRMDRYRSSAAVWFPQGPRSLAFAAGAASLAADADVYSSVLVGHFGIEMALLGESALRHDQVLIAHSDLPEGQAVAFAQADEALIGEELYAGTAYLSGRPLDMAGAIAMDLLRWIVIAAIIIAALRAAVE